VEKLTEQRAATKREIEKMQSAGLQGIHRAIENSLGCVCEGKVDGNPQEKQ